MDQYLTRAIGTANDDWNEDPIAEDIERTVSGRFNEEREKRMQISSGPGRTETAISWTTPAAGIWTEMTTSTPHSPSPEKTSPMALSRPSRSTRAEAGAAGRAAAFVVRISRAMTTAWERCRAR